VVLSVMMQCNLVDGYHCFSALKMEAISASETLVNKQLQKTTVKIYWEGVLQWNKAKYKAVSLYTTQALEGRGGIAPTHSRPRH
jgi:hypothetical protein